MHEKKQDNIEKGISREEFEKIICDSYDKQNEYKFLEKKLKDQILDAEKISESKKV